MAGEIAVDSHPGEGTVFRVNLSLQRLPETDSAAVPAKTADLEEGLRKPGLEAATRRAGAGTRLPRRVLVVEDNAINRHIACELLARLGLAAETAEDGAAALALLDAQPTAFALVLMDVQMPGMDGYEATRRLRADPRFAELPVLAITAHVLAEDGRRCRESGMDDHIAKPFDPPAFTETLGRWLGLDLSWDRNAGPSGDGSAEQAGAAEAPGPPSVSPDGSWIDWTAGVSGVGGDAALYDQLLAHFRASYEPLLARLVSDRSTERRDAILRTAHMLRGTAPMLGAASLAELAARVEDGLKGGGEPDGEAIAALRAGLSATLAEAATQGDGRGRQAPDTPVHPQA